MKKLFTILLMLVSFCAFSQNDNENIDSTNTALINSAGKSLERFERQHILGFGLTVVGSLITSLAYSSYSKTTVPNANKSRAFTILGVVVTLTGGIISLSSTSNVSAAGRKLRKVKAKK